MKVSILSTFDSGGGAARSALRLHRGLSLQGIESRFFTKSKTIDDQTIIGPTSLFEKILSKLIPRIEGLLLKQYFQRDRSRLFSPAYLGLKKSLLKASERADVVNLHWINLGFADIESLSSIHRPIVWTLHDSWVFTGGCHVPYECKKYEDQCGACPQLSSDNPLDISHRVLKRKREQWSQLDITFVCPSHWLKSAALKSTLLANKRVEVIPNGIETEVFKPQDKATSRKALGLDESKYYILYGAFGATSDRNKGYHFISPALKELAKRMDLGKVVLLVFGGTFPAENEKYDCEVKHLGTFTEDSSLSTLYSSADLMLVPSIQENLPNTVLESMSCGTPVVAFNIGGIPDIIEHCVTGYLAKPYESDDLANGIEWILKDDSRRNHLSIASRKKVLECFDLAIVAKRYKNLYEEICNTRKLSV